MSLAALTGAALAAAVPGALTGGLPTGIISDVDPETLLRQVPLFSQFLAVVVGGLGGAAVAARRGFDLTGVLGLAMMTGLGGLLLRDLLLQRGTPLVIVDGRFLLVAAVTAVVGWIAAGLIDRFATVLVLLDGLALGALVSVGAEGALQVGLGGGQALFVALVTATGGQIMRDVRAGDAPTLLRPGVFAGTAAFVGALGYVGMYLYTEVEFVTRMIITIGVVFAVRAVSASFKLEKTPASDLTDKLWAFWGRVTRR